MDSSSINKEMWIGENMAFEFEIEQNVNLDIGGDRGEQCVTLNSDNSDKDFNPQVRDDLKPKIGQEFQTLDEVKIFYNAYAKVAGFSVRNWTEKKDIESNKIIRKEYVCFKQGKGKVVDIPGTSRRRGSIREDCKAKIAVAMHPTRCGGSYVVISFVEGHTHPLSTPRKTHFLRSHRSISSSQKCLTQQLGMINIPPHQQFNFLGVQAGGFENIGFTQKDLYNQERDRRNELKGHDGDMLHEFLKLKEENNPSFTYKIATDSDQRIKHCFWADAISRRDYKCFGDVVIFDTTYNTNRYGMIFAPLVGVNNHGQTILFGCAFLSDETVDSFVWLFNCFLEAMPSDAPKMIITDQDPAMTRAISEALPHTYHRYCSWHILMKFPEKIDSLKFKAYYKDFSDCIWNSEMKEEFDAKWIDLVDKSGLTDNKWLRSMFEIRSQWVPAYVNHIFSAGMSSSQRAESAHSFLKKYVSKKNLLVDFMIQFGRGLKRRRQEELYADHKDLTEKPRLKIFHDALVQMVDIYTYEIFYKFQDEMWDITSYKFEPVKVDGNKHVYSIRRKTGDTNKVREIIYDTNLQFASCPCKMFESAGIPCRHVLAYLQKFHDIDALPSQYILKRWTKSAKLVNTCLVDACGIDITDDKSYFLQRSQLIQRSLDVIDTALTSSEGIQIYNEGLDDILEKIKKVVCIGSNAKVVVKPSVGVSVNMSCNYGNVYKEPQKVRAKGCGKRLKGGKEKAMGRVKKSKVRRCNGCGMVGQSHDKRNCPLINNRTDDGQGGSEYEESSYSTS